MHAINCALECKTLKCSHAFLERNLLFACFHVYLHVMQVLFCFFFLGVLVYFVYAYRHSTEGRKPETVAMERVCCTPEIPAEASHTIVQKIAEPHSNLLAIPDQPVDILLLQQQYPITEHKSDRESWKVILSLTLLIRTDSFAVEFYKYEPAVSTMFSGLL